MKLGTKLTLSLSLIIILMLSGYGYYHILSRRDILIRKMKVEVRSIGQTLRVSLEKISIPREMEFVQDLIDAVEEYEKTLGVIVYHQGRDLVFRSHSLGEDNEPYLGLIKRAIREDRLDESFGVYKEAPVFSYIFPLKDRKGKNLGGVCILQNTFLMDEDIRRAKWNIFVTIILLIGGTVTLVLFVTRRWITRPIAQLLEGIRSLSKGDLRAPVDLKRGDELSNVAQAFNQMAIDLKQAQERIIREAEARLELERSLRQSEKLATIGQLASGLAHEIGTPLNIIGGRAELAKRRLWDKEGTQKNLDIIIQQTERITKIIQQLLGFARKKKPEQKPLEVHTLLGTTLDFLGHQIKKQKVKTVTKISDHLPRVIGDPDQLQQIFLNLILNAVQSMPGGGTLHLTAFSEWISKEGLEDSPHPYIVVNIEDTGAGMERDVMENIFNPFFTTKETGTGLGLMVTQGIVQDHEGWLEVESVVGKGTVLKVYLPSLSAFTKGDGIAPE